MLKQEQVNGVKPTAIENDDVALALDPLHMQKRGEMLAAVLRNVEEQREGLRLEQSFGGYENDQPIPNMPAVNGHVRTFGDRWDEFEAGLKRLKGDAPDEVWAIGYALYKDPAWEPRQ